MKKNKNVIKFPKDAGYTKEIKTKARKTIEGALDDNYEYVLVAGIQKDGTFKIRSNCGKPALSMVLAESALTLYKRLHPHQLITGKYPIDLLGE
jgi:hypothetical protein